MDAFHNCKTKHLALIQFHRWFQFYERPVTPRTLQHQLAILADDVLIESKSAMGISQGKEKYKERVKLAEGTLNAHHVQTAEVRQLHENSLQLEATILHHIILPDQNFHNHILKYKALLIPVQNSFPLFYDIKIEPIAASTATFKDAYFKNRGASLMHCWLLCIENIQENLLTFKELLAKDFELNLSTGKRICNWKEFQQWLNEISHKIKKSLHVEKNLFIEENEEGTFTLNVDFEWYGQTFDNKIMHGKTHHEWVLENDPTERFARIKKMVVQQAQPFTVIAEMPILAE